MRIRCVVTKRNLSLIFYKSSADFKRVIRELELKLEDTESALKSERTQRERLELQSIGQQSKINELSKSFEHKLRKRDEQIVLKAGQDIVELGNMKQRLEEVDSLLKERDGKIQSVNERKEKLQEELDMERRKLEEAVRDADVLKREMKEMREQNVRNMMVVGELEGMNKELKKQIKKLCEENNSLRVEIESCDQLRISKLNEYEGKLQQYQSVSCLFLLI